MDLNYNTINLFPVLVHHFDVNGFDEVQNELIDYSYSKRKENRVHHAVRRDVLTNKIMHAMATGNWTGGRAGVSQLLDRTCNMSTLSHLRRVISPLTRSQPVSYTHLTLPTICSV